MQRECESSVDLVIRFNCGVADMAAVGGTCVLVAASGQVAVACSTDYARSQIDHMPTNHDMVCVLKGPEGQ